MQLVAFPQDGYFRSPDAVELLETALDKGVEVVGGIPHFERTMKEGKKDACYKKVKSRYSVWPSAYASGALVKCRKVGAANWGNKSKKEKGGLATSLMSDVYGSGRKLKKK